MFWKRILKPLKKSKITFRPESPQMNGAGFQHPLPAKSYIPEWYRKMPNRLPGANAINKETGEVDHTVKSCVPLLDAFATGYIQELNEDLYIEPGPGDSANFWWPRQHPWEPVRGQRNHKAMQGFPAPAGYISNPYLWIQPFEVGLPKGWSALITHPLNRNDLPFLTMSAVIDMDDFPQRSEVAFFMKSGWTGMIPKGTPIFQVIPFKRENWETELFTYEEPHRMKFLNMTRNVFSSGYKDNFWKKKEYGGDKPKSNQARSPESGNRAVQDVGGKCPVMHGGEGTGIKEVGGE